MVTTGWFRGDLLVLTIDDGARPDRRRMIRGLQPPAAEMTGFPAHPLHIPPGAALVGLTILLWMVGSQILRVGVDRRVRPRVSMPLG